MSRALELTALAEAAAASLLHLRRPAPPAPDMEEVEEDMQRLLAGGNSAKGGPDVTTAHITAVVKSVKNA